MVQKLITMLVIFLFLALVIAGLQALFGDSSNGAQEISHHMVFLSIPAGLASTAFRADLL